MADIVLSGNANWSTCNGGSVPAGGDSVLLNGYALNMDGANGSTYTCVEIRACNSSRVASAGTITLANATSTINADIRAGTTGHLLTVGASKTLTVNGTVTGGSGYYGIYQNGNSSSVTATAAVGSGSNGGHGIVQTGSSSTCTVTTATGGSAVSYGVYSSSGTATITTAIGGSVGGAAGVSVQGGTVTVGTAKRGSHAQAGAIIYMLGQLTVNAWDTSAGAPMGNIRIGAATVEALDGSGNAKSFGAGGGRRGIMGMMG